MISAILSFLGGSVFRMLWGEISAFVNRQQEHRHEIERMQLQAQLDAAQHERNLAAIRVQAEMGIKVVEAKSEAAVAEAEVEGWLEAVKATGRRVGIAWVDAWNAVIRPGVATWAVVMLSLEAFALITLTEATASVAFAALGIYLADRALGKRGK